MLWHRRLGHPNKAVLKRMIRDGVCVGLPLRLTKTIPCEECAISQSTKLDTIGPLMQQYNAPLSLVVADLIVPFQVKTNKALQSFFKEKGITVQHSQPYAHEQAGIIERSNRTIQATMRVLLRESGLTKDFWGLEIVAGSYLHN